MLTFQDIAAWVSKNRGVFIGKCCRNISTAPALEVVLPRRDGSRTRAKPAGYIGDAVKELINEFYPNVKDYREHQATVVFLDEGVEKKITFYDCNLQAVIDGRTSEVHTHSEAIRTSKRVKAFNLVEVAICQLDA